MLSTKNRISGRRAASLLLTVVMVFSIPTMAPIGAGVTNEYSVRVFASPSEGGGPTATPSNALEGSTVTLNANPWPGYIFEQWVAEQTLMNSQISDIFAPQATFTMPGGDVTVRANYRASSFYPVSVTINIPAGGDVTGAPSGNVMEGSPVNLTAVPKDGYRFVNWTGDFTSSSPAISFTMPNSPANLTANFAPNNVSIVINPVGSGSVTSEPTNLNAVTSGTTVRLVASANTGFSFENWSGLPLDALSVGNEASFHMPSDRDVTVTANFRATGFTVTVNQAAGGTASSSVTSAASGESVTLTATPESGQGFSQWVSTGTAIGNFDAAHRNNNPATFSMPNGNVVVTPVFGTARSVTVNRNNNNWGSAQITNTIAVAAGGRVHLRATPASGYTFLRWETEPLNAFSFANPQSADSASFIMPSGTGAVTVRAIFEQSGSVVLTSNNTTWGTATFSPANPARGSTVTMTAYPSSGYALSYWRAITPSNLAIANNYTQNATFVMPSSGNVSIEAVFAAGHQLTVASNNVSMGTARPTSNSGAAPFGTTVSLTATAENGHRFVRWTTTSSGVTGLNDSTANPLTFTMPNNAVNIRAVFEVTGQAVTLNVNNISGASAVISATNTNAVTATPSTSASIAVSRDATVTMTAIPPSGYALSNWEVLTAPSGFSNASITNRFSTTATFTMPSGAVSVRANFALGRQVTVTSNNISLGTAEPNSGAAQSNATVTLTATPVPGNRFVRWEATSGSVTFNNANSMTTTFTMPSTAVSIRAVFEAGQAVTADGGVSIGYSQSGGVITLIMPTEKVAEIISAASGSLARIDMTRVTGVTTATFPRAALTQLANASLGIELRLPQGTIALNQAATRSATNQAGSTSVSVSLAAVAQSTLTASERASIKASDTVYSITFFSGAQAISSFDGSITITVPYFGQLPVAVWHLSGGILTKLTSTHNSSAHTVAFNTSRLSLFVVGFDGESTVVTDNPFTDVRSGDWFYGDVLFAYGNRLMGGTSTSPMRFSPNTPLSRAMLVTILYRYQGEPNVAGFANPFSDVPSGQWYTNAIVWAAANRVVSGIAEGRFGTNNNITRQDLAVILINYANFRGLKLPTTQTYKGFNDDSRIASYARPAVIRCFEAGIIGGKPGNLFDPLGQSTRAETAAMLHRFIKAIS